MSRPAPIVELGPPTREVRDAVAQLYVELLTRRALVEVGILPEVDDDKPEWCVVVQRGMKAA